MQRITSIKIKKARRLVISTEIPEDIQEILSIFKLSNSPLGRRLANDLEETLPKLNPDAGPDFEFKQINFR